MPTAGMIDGLGLPVPPSVWTEYNGFRFPEGYTRTTEFDARAVPDAAGRTVGMVEYTLALEADLIGYSPTDAYVVDALCRLKEYGKPFRYEGRGFGNLTVNFYPPNVDVMFGPKPEGVRVTDITAVYPGFPAPRKICRIAWRVVVRTLPCCSAVTFGLSPMELTYTVGHRVLPNGASARTVAGELRVANNRVYPDAATPIYSPDDYWGQIVPEVPVRFRREFAERVVSTDRTKLTFGWTDTEFANAVYPEGVTRAEFGQEVGSTGMGLVQWSVTLRGRYDIAYGFDYTAGEKAFWTDVKDRIDENRKRPENVAAEVAYIPTEYRVGEPNKYEDLTCTFALTYLVTKVGLDQIIPKTGMFNNGMPFGKDAAWDLWNASIRQSVHSPVGWLQLKFRAEDDKIIDACSQDPAGVTESQGSAQQTPAGFVWKFPKPTKQGSWLHVESNLRVESDSGVVRLRALPQSEVKKPDTQSGFRFRSAPVQPLPSPSGYPDSRPPAGRPSAAEFARVAADADGGFRSLAGGHADPPADASPSQAVDPVAVQRRVEPTIVLIHTGIAIRAGYDIPCPELTEVDDGEGGTLVPVKDNREDVEYFATGVVFNGLVPLVGAAWEQRYVLSRTPKAPINSPPNPVIDPVDEGEFFTGLP